MLQSVHFPGISNLRRHRNLVLFGSGEQSVVQRLCPIQQLPVYKPVADGVYFIVLKQRFQCASIWLNLFLASVYRAYWAPIYIFSPFLCTTSVFSSSLPHRLSVLTSVLLAERWLQDISCFAHSNSPFFSLPTDQSPFHYRALSQR